MTSMEYYTAGHHFFDGSSTSSGSSFRNSRDYTALDPYALQQLPCACETCMYYANYGLAPPHHAMMSPVSPLTPVTSAPNTPHYPYARAQPMYTHNPYGEGIALESAPSPPEKLAPAPYPQPPYSAFVQQHSTPPVYQAETIYSESAQHPVAYSLEEQFNHAIGTLANLACSSRGRALLQSVLRLQHVDKISIIFSEFVPEFERLIVDQNASHVVRQLVEYLNATQMKTLVGFITRTAATTLAVHSQQSRRILQTIFECHKGDCLSPLVYHLADDAPRLATTQQGCIAVMRVIENTADAQKMMMLNALAPQIAKLTTDPYGNYVVQSLFQCFSREVMCDIVEKYFTAHFVSLSCNKFGSNVMEKVVLVSSASLRRSLVEHLVMNPTNLATMMHDGFGNFVLQSIIDSCTTAQEFQRISQRVRPMLQNCPYGHKIEAKLRGKRFTKTDE